MTTEPYSGRLTTLDATVAAERLLAALHDEDGTFAEQFYKADRDMLGAVIAYADLLIRELSSATGQTPATVRHQTRLWVSETQSMIERLGETQ